jgi:hypothetical protein
MGSVSLRLEYCGVIELRNKNGTVLFPRSRCKQLLGQIFNLGVEEHDDLWGALVWLLHGLVRLGLESPNINWIEA